MAKIKRGIISISGKVDDKVLVSGGSYKDHVRKADTKKKQETHPSFKKQNKSAPIFNQLASELNNIVKSYSGRLKPTGFYHKLLKIFRRTQENDRFLLLSPLRQMEINPDHRFGSLGSCEVRLEEMKNKVAVKLVIKSHPLPGRYNADGYFYEVTWVHWLKNKPGAVHSRQYSDWISVNGKEPKFEFIFSRPAAATHWLLLLRTRLGANRKLLDYMVTEGMQIAEVGTFDKKEQEIWQKKKEAINAKPDPQNEIENVVRVKAKE
ncbi:MAG: hypothetical protein Q8941_07765 [Bacteroidota bacterium]|nr:hypothetical protein [Bacteroidota bacterium]